MEILSDRISVVRNDTGTSVVISSAVNRKKSRAVLAILLLWLIGGVLIIWNFSSIHEDKTKIIVMIWLAFWLYFFYVLFRLYRWKQAGHEILKIVGGKLKYKKDVKGRGWVQDYDLEKIRKLRSSDTETPGWVKNIGGDFWNTDCDSIRFDYEDKEISIGFQLDSAERGKLIKLIGEFVEVEVIRSKRSQKEENWKKEES
jgi:hypothetical protein